MIFNAILNTHSTSARLRSPSALKIHLCPDFVYCDFNSSAMYENRIPPYAASPQQPYKLFQEPLVSYQSGILSADYFPNRVYNTAAPA